MSILLAVMATAILFGLGLIAMACVAATQYSDLSERLQEARDTGASMTMHTLRSHLSAFSSVEIERSRLPGGYEGWPRGGVATDRFYLFSRFVYNIYIHTNSEGVVLEVLRTD
jgi:hypothetical protein